MSRGRLAVGLIGVGRLGRVYARDLAGRIAETRLVAVADPFESLARDVAAEFDVPRHYADPFALLDDPAVDAAVIVSPTHTHREIALAAASRGKPAFCEKPPALSLDEVAAIEDAIARSGTFFQMGLIRQFDEGYASAKRKIEKEHIDKTMILKKT
jgi:predicted dehydrogenase